MSAFHTPTVTKRKSTFGDSTVGLQKKVGIPLLCINEFINYINYKIEKYPDKYKGIEYTTAENVVQNLIQLLNRKGFENLDEEIVNQIHKDLSKSKFPRKQIVHYIQRSVNKDLVTETQIPQTLRNLFTFSRKLDEATEQTIDYAKQAGLIESSQIYGKTAYSLGPQASFTPLSDKELYFINNSPFYTKSKHFTSIGHILSGRKTKCADCWICGKEIYIYHLYKKQTTVDDPEWDLEVTCGQDEHVFPPGWGNLVGTLLSTYKSTIEDFDDTNLKQSVFGLRPSHDWCNQLKRDRILVNPPGFSNGIITPENTGFSVNTEEVEKLVNACRDKLESTHGYESYEPWFWPDQRKKSKTQFVNGIRHNVTSTLNTFCEYVNNPKMTGEYHDVYTMHLLQIIFNMCWFAGSVIFKDKQEFVSAWNDNLGFGGSNKRNKRTNRRKKRRNKTLRIKGGTLTETDTELFEELFPANVFDNNRAECSDKAVNSILTSLDETLVLEPTLLNFEEDYNHHPKRGKY